MTARKRKPPAPVPTSWEALVTQLRAVDDLPPRLAELVTELPDELADAPADLRHRVATEALAEAVRRSPSEWSGRTAATAAMVTTSALAADAEGAARYDEDRNADPLTRRPPEALHN